MLGSMHRLIDKEWVYGYTEGKRQIMREKEIWNKGCEHNNHYMMFSIEPPTAKEGRGVYSGYITLKRSRDSVPHVPASSRDIRYNSCSFMIQLPLNTV